MLINENYENLDNKTKFKVFNTGECLFFMLDFLNNVHPVVRYLAKTWLLQLQSLKNFNIILDFLIEVAMEFDVRRNIETFRKLTNIFLNLNDSFMEYLFNTEVADDITFLEKKIYSDLNIKLLLPLDNYFELLVSISLRQIQNKVIY